MPYEHGNWWKSGGPWVWLTAGAVCLCMLAVVGLLLLIGARGLAHFWPSDVYAFRYQAPEDEVMDIIASIRDTEAVSSARLLEAGLQLEGDTEFIDRHLVKTGNRDRLGTDFRFLIDPLILERSQPPDVAIIERTEWGDQIGFLRAVKEDGRTVPGNDLWSEFQERIARVADLRERIRGLERGTVGSINYELEQLRLERRRLQLSGGLTEDRVADLGRRRAELDSRYAGLQQDLAGLHTQINRDAYVVEIQDGTTVELPLANVVRAYQPNLMGFLDKAGFYCAKAWEFVSDDPREANTEGGVFPAIFGTVVMVMLMSVIVTPFGVIAAVYLRSMRNRECSRAPSASP
jgi:phosphate transport system permease protein